MPGLVLPRGVIAEVGWLTRVRLLGLIDPEITRLLRAMLRHWIAGTALALTAGVAVDALGARAFARLVRHDVRALDSGASRDEVRLVGEEMLVGLPEPVQRYLRFTGVVGKPFVRRVHLRKRGRMQLGRGQPWVPLKAEQWYTVQPPGFVWDCTLFAGPVPVVRARDLYRAGEGHMLIKAVSAFTVADAKGEKLDQGEMMRYLNEMMWFPSAFLEGNVSFDAVDSTSARVTLSDHGTRVTATMFFDADGRLTEFVGKRYAGGQLETWSVPVVAYGELAGLQLPRRCRAVWKLARGDQEYIDVMITELDHDPVI